MTRLWSAALLAFAVLSGCAPAGTLGDADADRLGIELRAATRDPAISEGTARSVAAANVGFAPKPETKIETFLADMSGSDRAPDGTTVWIVRYSGSVPVSAPAPINPDGTVASHPPVKFGYAILDAMTGEVLELSYYAE